jgi:hypothetical protein
MAGNIGKEARERAKKYKKALKYLDGCKKFTYEDLIETNRLAGNAMTEEELRRMWDMSEQTIAGAEGYRQILRNTLIEGINAFERIADELGK